MLKQTKQTKGLFKSTQAVVSASATSVIAGSQALANEVLLMKSKNLVENIRDYDDSKDEALLAYDDKLDQIEQQLSNPDLAPRRRARLERMLAMAELSANTIEALKLEIV